MTGLIQHAWVAALLAMGTAGAHAQSMPVSQPAAATQSAPADDVAVTVNGHPILESTVAELVKTRMPRNTRELSPATVQELVRGQVLDQLIEARLVEEQVTRAGTKMTEEEYAEKAREELEGYLSLNGLKRAEFADEIKADKGKTLEEFLAERQADPGRRQALLGNKFIAEKFPEEVRVTDDQLQEQYQLKRERRFTKPERVRASQILIGTTGMTDEQKAEARKQAETILSEARAPGADFAALAAKHSTDSSKTKGGDLGYFPRSGVMPEPIATAAFTLKIGEVSDLIETNAGYHILKVTGKQEAMVIPFEQAKAGLRTLLTDQKLLSARVRYGAELRKDAKIVFPPGKEPRSGRSLILPQATSAPVPAIAPGAPTSKPN